MRVLHVLGELRHSGAETMLAAAGSAFSELGVESEIVSTGAAVGSFASRLRRAGYRVHHVSFEKRPSHFLRMYRLMRSGRYDVIHLHTERANVWFGLVALAARPGRVVRTIHNVFSFEGALRWRRGAQRRLLNRLGVTHVACSASVEQNERTRFGLRTVLVPNWYDSARFRPSSDVERARARRSLGLLESDTVLVSVGNCSPVKNHTALIGALSRLSDVENVVYLHVGEEESGHPERALARALGIEDTVRFLGSVDDVPALFASADLFVMPSLYEGFPIAPLEALASGLPSILADVPGLSDFRALYSALAFAEPTVDSLTSALDRYVRASRADLRAEAAAFAEITRTHFGIEAGVRRYVSLYSGLSPDGGARTAP